MTDRTNTIRSITHVTLVGAVVNIVLAIAKTTIGILSGSQALVADGVHSLSDLATDFAVVVGARFWTAPADAKHPYGHGRIETMINIAIGVLIGAVGLGIGYNAIVTLNEPHTNTPGVWALLAALGSIVAKEILFRWTARKGRALRSSAVVANAWHHRSDAISSIPVAIAVVGGWIWPEITSLDHIAALVVTVLLLRATWHIIGPSWRELLEARSEGEFETRILKHAEAFPQIRELHKIRCRTLGGSGVIDLHMLVDPATTVADAHALTEQFQQHVLAAEPDVLEVLIHVEPWCES
ncbi:MAG: cation transporter [Phycisphaerales bacterium]|jgi:cation diffusion facilitator family transporter|nr:cation transporter [Phycisphaerales bacterium]